MIRRYLLALALISSFGLLAQEHGQAQPETKQAEPAHGTPASGQPAAGGESHGSPSAPAGGQAASHGEAAHGAGGHDSGDPLILWKWVNFALLAGVLGYLASKNLPAFFKERDEEIQRELAEARQLKSEADARSKEVEQRMARMEAEIEALRSNAKTEMAAEGERISKETQQMIAKVRASAEHEITSIAKAARIDLKNQAARLAIDLAEQRIRDKAQGVDANLVSAFIRDLDRKGAQN